MRILHVAHQQWRNYGHNRISWAQKLYFGLIRNGHCVQAFSDRDIAAFEAPFGLRDLGKRKTNQRLLQTVAAFEPDVVIVGHCDIIRNQTLDAIRKLNRNIVIVGCNNDPLFVPENANKIDERCEVVDWMFVSTGAKELKRFAGKRATLAHMPNPVDASIEVYDVSAASNFDHDVVFCSREVKHSKRGKLLEALKTALPTTIRFSTPGSFGQKGVWGRDYDHFLERSKMGLNLNRQEGYHWYSSARMAQMAGNGLLTFTHSMGDFSSLLPPETLVYFDDEKDLTAKIIEFHQDDAKRRDWASRAREFFHREINSTLFAQYIVEMATGQTPTHDYVWVR